MKPAICETTFALDPLTVAEFFAGIGLVRKGSTNRLVSEYGLTHRVGVAQSVACRVLHLDVAGSNPVAPTKSPPDFQFSVVSMSECTEAKKSRTPLRRTLGTALSALLFMAVTSSCDGLQPAS